MEFVKRQLSGNTVIEIKAQAMNYVVASELKKYLIKSLEGQSGGALVVDVSNVNYIDSSGLGALLAAYRDTGSRSRIAVAGARNQVANTLRIGRIAKLMPVIGCVDDVLHMNSDDWPTAG